tara:strand:- start:253 stop:615 length:363 start_codon:yes stop_codon:yes gene_type:complete
MELEEGKEYYFLINFMRVKVKITNKLNNFVYVVDDYMFDESTNTFEEEPMNSGTILTLYATSDFSPLHTIRVGNNRELISNGEIYTNEENMIVHALSSIDWLKDSFTKYKDNLLRLKSED